MNSEIEELIRLEKELGTNYVEQSLGYKPVTNLYGLNETEFLLIRMLVSNGEDLIQKHLYEGTTPSELDSLLYKYLDSALTKLPTEDTTDIVFRVTNKCIYTKKDIGLVHNYPAYLTASVSLLSSNCTCEYKIRLAGRTKAKSIYKAYELMPGFPEKQVEFQRNTKFYVKDVYEQDGITKIELCEMLDNPWPAEKLTGNITDFFKGVSAIDIADAVSKGLNPEIHLMRTLKGKVINSMCTKDGEVYISPTFAQALWNMSYVGLWLSDYGIVTEELKKEGKTLDWICKEIDTVNSMDSCSLYFKAIQNAYEWEPMLCQSLFLLRNQFSSSDDKFLGDIKTDGELEKRVSSLYITGMGCILLHELMHHYGNHFQRLKNENIKDLELEADNRAFDSILAMSGQVRQSAILGGIAAQLLLLYMDPTLSSKSNYYREDVRLFTQYDKIDDKRRASIFVANVLSDWLKRFHNIDIQVKHNHEEETVDEIREIIKTHI